MEMIGRLLVFGFGFGGGVVAHAMHMEVWSIAVMLQSGRTRLNKFAPDV